MSRERTCLLVLLLSLRGCAGSTTPASAPASVVPPPEQVTYRTAPTAPRRRRPSRLPASTPSPRPPVEGSVTISDIGQVTFAPDSARLDKASAALLDRLVPMLRKTSLRLEGHADREEKDAAVLSLQRARAVQRYLVAKGVPAAQLVASGYAATQCVAPSDTEENRRLNRRVELVQPED